MKGTDSFGNAFLNLKMCLNAVSRHLWILSIWTATLLFGIYFVSGTPVRPEQREVIVILVIIKVDLLLNINFVFMKSHL